MIFTTFVYAVTLYQYYNATIVSSLLLEAPRNIRTLKDLLDSDLKAGSHDIVYDKDYFKVIMYMLHSEHIIMRHVVNERKIKSIFGLKLYS